MKLLPALGTLDRVMRAPVARSNICRGAGDPARSGGSCRCHRCGEPGLRTHAEPRAAPLAVPSTRPKLMVGRAAGSCACHVTELSAESPPSAWPNTRVAGCRYRPVAMLTTPPTARSALDRTSCPDKPPRAPRATRHAPRALAASEQRCRRTGGRNANLCKGLGWNRGRATPWQATDSPRVRPPTPHAAAAQTHAHSPAPGVIRRAGTTSWHGRWARRSAPGDKADLLCLADGGNGARR